MLASVRHRMTDMANLRAIPSVEQAAQALEPLPLPRPMAMSVIRGELARLRRSKSIPPRSEILEQLGKRLHETALSRLQPVINGTGVIIHTNLGRAPLAPDALQLLQQTASGYCNLELDLGSGKRGSRGLYVEQALALLCRAPAATVVNNCASALILMLRLLTRDKPEVVISRGELVQIGGGFKIPEILEATGAHLREVGTTNRTRLADYAKAVSKDTGLILKVHRSNFFMEGFVASPSTGELSTLAKRKRIPFVEDLGSGALIATEAAAGIEHEPTPAEILRQGVDLVCFSGDKLMGGPQAGIIAGRRKLVQALKQDPFFRALRCDKLVLSALQATVEAYLDAGGGKAGLPKDLPAIRMLTAPPAPLKKRAQRIADALSGAPAIVQVVERNARIGGGTLPRSELKSFAIAIKPLAASASALAALMRQASPPVIGTLAEGFFHIDLRTVFPQQDPAIIQALGAALNRNPLT